FSVALDKWELDTTAPGFPGTAGKRLLQRASDKVTQFHSAERRFGFDSLEERVRQVNRSSHKSRFTRSRQTANGAEEVFRGMFQGDKLLNPRNVSACIQVHASERVGNGFRHSITLDSMHEQRCEGRRRGQLWPQLLVAARCHEDQLCVSRNRSIESVISRCIAGV